MSFKILMDSCGEATEELKNSGCFESVPLEILLGKKTIIDDETFDQKEFLKAVAREKESPKSSCPSPQRYMEGYCCEAENIFVVTLSAELSGSYNSAVLGKKLYEEEYGEKSIHVFNSRSASVGETLIALKVMACQEEGMGFEDTVLSVEQYIQEQRTYFVLENLDTLRKNGRLTGLKAVVATALNIKPLMGSTPEGTICQLGQSRGIKRVLQKMVEKVTADTEKSGKTLAISHCNAPERARAIQAEFEKTGRFGTIIVTDTAGISSMYAADGGVIVVV